MNDVFCIQDESANYLLKITEIVQKFRSDYFCNMLIKISLDIEVYVLVCRVLWLLGPRHIIYNYGLNQHLDCMAVYGFVVAKMTLNGLNSFSRSPNKMEIVMC